MFTGFLYFFSHLLCPVPVPGGVIGTWDHRYILLFLIDAWDSRDKVMGHDHMGQLGIPSCTTVIRLSMGHLDPPRESRFV
jgi:hypothetical protein